MAQTSRPKPPVPRDYNHLIKDWALALQNLRDGRARYAGRIKTITDACRASHGKAHPVECEPCYDAIIEETRRRYLGAGAGDGGDGRDEWFSGQVAFLRDLDRALDDAKQRRASLGDVEALIGAAKKAWYRGVLRDYPYFVDVALNSADGLPRFRELVADARQSEGDLADVVRRGIGRLRGDPVDVEAYVSASAATSREEMSRLLFEADGPGRSLEGTEAYAALCADAASGLSAEQVMGVIDRDRIGAVAGAEERAGRVRRAAGERARKLEERRGRLQELQRARTAHRKIQRARSQKLGGKFYAPQSCPGCAAEVGGKGDVLACSLCQVLLDMGLGSTQTVYCSMKCCEEVHDSHTKSRHPCSSGESCLQHTPSPPTPATVLCKECTTHLSIATPYCSTACAASTMKTHLQDAHPVVWAQAKDSLAGTGGGDGGGGALAPMADVDGYVVGLTEVHSDRVGKKLKRSSLVDV